MRNAIFLCVLCVICCPRRTALAADSSVSVPQATGLADPRLASFNRLLTRFLDEHELPGAAVAVSRKGRLIYARGFGYADRAGDERVRPRSLFRIASISKPITAVAVMQLVERRRLKLDDRVFTVLQLQREKGKEEHFDPRWQKVTILQLLQHRGGWDRGQSFDPMFRSPAIVKELGVASPARPWDVIHYMLHRPLDFDPGSRFAYSNFGYCLLGRVIEKVSGQSYETYVRAHVLAPLGIHDMRLGATLPKDRVRGEVHYYVPWYAVGPAVMGPRLGKLVSSPYGVWSLESLDALGGWLASAPDLVRFASALDTPSRCKILKPESVKLLFARPPGAAGLKDNGESRATYYACGWMVRPVGKTGRFNFWHFGGLPGTSTLLVRRHDGLIWAVLFNSRHSAKKATPAAAIDPLMHQAAADVRNWPHGNSLLRYKTRNPRRTASQKTRRKSNVSSPRRANDRLGGNAAN